MGTGKTYSTKYLLDSNNSSGVAGQVLSTTSTGINWVDANTTPGTGLWLASGNNIYNSNSGNVGIGTASPGSKLEISDTSDALLELNGGATANPYMLFAQNGTRTAFIQYVNGGLLSLVSEYGGIRFMTGTGGTETEKIRIDSSGNVGIGTTSPGYKLDVNGTSRFVSQLNFENNLFGSGYIAGTTTEKVKKIKNTALESSTETGTAVVHPYFNNDLGNWVARGGTVTFGGLNTTPSLAQQNIMFEPTQDFLGLNSSNITGSTWSITLTSTNSGQMNLNYGCWIGITFGSTSFDPDSMLIETNTNADGSGTWTTVLNSSVSDTCYYTYQNVGGTGVRAIKFTMGQTSQGPRVCNIFAYNYAADGMKHFFLGKQGGSVFGNIIPGTDYINGGTNFPKLGASGNRWNEIWVDKISDINNSFGTSGQVLSSNASGQLDWISGSALPGGPYLPLAGGTLTGDLTLESASPVLKIDATGLGNPEIFFARVTGDDQNAKIRLMNNRLQFENEGDPDSDFLFQGRAAGSGALSDFLKIEDTGIVTSGGIFTGNVGIGTSSPESNVRNYKLQLKEAHNLYKLRYKWYIVGIHIKAAQ